MYPTVNTHWNFSRTRKPHLSPCGEKLPTEAARRKRLPASCPILLTLRLHDSSSRSPALVDGVRGRSRHQTDVAIETHNEGHAWAFPVLRSVMFHRFRNPPVTQTRPTPFHMLRNLPLSTPLLAQGTCTSTAARAATPEGHPSLHGQPAKSIQWA